MKKLFTSLGAVDVDLLKGLLEDAGIGCEIRNENIQKILPRMAFAPAELWVMNDKDFDRAVEIKTAWETKPAAQAAWTCPKCGEQLEGQFLSCWKCGTSHPVSN